MHNSRKYWLGVIFTLLLSACRLNAGGGLDYSVVESKTYEYYLAKNWKELLRLSNKALAQGIDYYYLRVRTGIACYELGRYRQAIPHFEKALKFNEGDQLSQEYLYFAYLYSDRPEDARKLSISFSSEMAGYMKTKKLPLITSMFIEGGTKMPDSVSLFQPALFGQLGLNHFIEKKISWTHAFNFYLQDESRFNYTQYQYYLRSNIPLGNGFMMQGGAHLLYTSSVVKEYAIGQETVQPKPSNPGAPPPPVQTTTRLVEVDSYEQALGLVTAVNLMKQTHMFDFSVNASVYFHDSTTQYQSGLGFVYYPFSNNNLALGYNAFLHSEDKFTTYHIASAPFVNVRMGKRVFVNVSVLFNKGGNISENAAMFVNNAYDKTLTRITLSPSLVLSKRFTVYLTAGTETKRQSNSGYNYHYLVGLAGLRYSPSKTLKKRSHD